MGWGGCERWCGSVEIADVARTRFNVVLFDLGKRLGRVRAGSNSDATILAVD